jgi:hypothetical protein
MPAGAAAAGVRRRPLTCLAAAPQLAAQPEQLTPACSRHLHQLSPRHSEVLVPPAGPPAHQLQQRVRVRQRRGAVHLPAGRSERVRRARQLPGRQRGRLLRGAGRSAKDGRRVVQVVCQDALHRQPAVLVVGRRGRRLDGQRRRQLAGVRQAAGVPQRPLELRGAAAGARTCERQQQVPQSPPEAEEQPPAAALLARTVPGAAAGRPPPRLSWRWRWRWRAPRWPPRPGLAQAGCLPAAGCAAARSAPAPRARTPPGAGSPSRRRTQRSASAAAPARRSGRQRRRRGLRSSSGGGGGRQPGCRARAGQGRPSLVLGPGQPPPPGAAGVRRHASGRCSHLRQRCC